MDLAVSVETHEVFDVLVGTMFPCVSIKDFLQLIWQGPLTLALFLRHMFFLQIEAGLLDHCFLIVLINEGTRRRALGVIIG